NEKAAVINCQHEEYPSNPIPSHRNKCNNALSILKKYKNKIIAIPPVGSLALTSTIDNEELKYFLSLRHQTSVAFKIYGTEPIPGRMLSPSYIRVIMPLELKKFLHEWLPKTYLLAYIRWYKCASSSATRFKYSFMNSEVSNTEIWKTEHYKEGYDSILPVHRILCRAIKIKYCVGNSENYISIVPLNRRFNF
ncbi:33107_t:CDS:2, partial [Gigaspora margarita]